MNKLLFLQIIDKISKNALFDRNMIKNVLIPIVRASQKDERTIQKFRKALKKLPDCRYCDCKRRFMEYKTDTILTRDPHNYITGPQNIPADYMQWCCERFLMYTYPHKNTYEFKYLNNYFYSNRNLPPDDSDDECEDYM